MKRIAEILFIIITILPSFLVAQNRSPQNVRRVIVTSQYEIKDGQRTGMSMAIKQEIKDSLDRMHTILNRDYKTQRLISHTWHTFNGRLLTRTDEFENEKLKHFIIYTFNTDSTIAMECIYKVNVADTILYTKLTHKYNNFKKRIQTDAYDIKGKKVYRVKSVYDTRGTEIKRTVKVKKNYLPLDSVINMVKTPVYDSLGRLSSEIITRKSSNGKIVIESFRYGYDKAGLISVVEVLDELGKVITRKTMEYNKKGILKYISVFDSNNRLIEFYAKRYELYPSRDRRNQIIEH